MSEENEPADLNRPLNVAPFWQVRRTAAATAIDSDTECDTAIIGAGVAGLSVAAALVDTQKVALIDANLIGEGSSGWSAGILSAATTVDLDKLEGLLGEENTRKFIFFFSDAIAQMKQALALDDRDWQFGKSMYLAAGRSHKKLIDGELEARRRFGLPATYLDDPDLLKPWPKTEAALELPDEHAVHPVKLLLSLAARVAGQGGTIFEGTRARWWKHDGERFIIDCGTHQIAATNLVVATGIKSGQWKELADVDRVCVQVTSHVLVTESSDEIAKMVKEKGRIAMWDSLELYHYVRYLPDGRMLVGGADEPGESAPESLPPSHPRVVELHQWAQRHHKAKIPPVEFAWKAALVVPADGLPLLKVKRVKDSVFAAVVTDGIPSAFLMGNVVARLIREGEHPLARLIASGRKLPQDAALLALLPSGSPLRAAFLKAGFAGLALKDSLA